MSNEDDGLSQQQKEMVALGASVGAGCQPCVNHHLDAAHKAELADDRVRTAITTAQLVAAQAADEMARHVQRKLNVEDLRPTAPAALDTELSAFGANDRTNIQRHLTAAVTLGVSRSRLQQALEVAHTVQTNAAAIHLRAAQHLLDELAPVETPTTGDSRSEDGGFGGDTNA
jgi:AhpD family alkylhydroperoxidase